MVKVVGVVEILGSLGAVADAAVALHALADDVVGVCRVDGLQGTFLGAAAALGAGILRLGLHGQDVDGVAVAVAGV